MYSNNRIVAIPHMTGISTILSNASEARDTDEINISKYLFGSFMYNSVVVFCLIGWSKYLD